MLLHKFTSSIHLQLFKIVANILRTICIERNICYCERKYAQFVWLTEWAHHSSITFESVVMIIIIIIIIALKSRFLFLFCFVLRWWSNLEFDSENEIRTDAHIFGWTDSHIHSNCTSHYYSIECFHSGSNWMHKQCCFQNATLHLIHRFFLFVLY